MDQLLQQAQVLSQTGNADARQKTSLALMKLAYALESADDMIQRIGALHLQSAAIITGLDLSLFKTLVSAAGPLTTNEVAMKVRAEITFTGRLLRFLASIGMVDETAKDQYSANHSTKNLSETVSGYGLRHYFYTCGPQYQELPKFMKKSGYQLPKDEMHTVFQQAHKTCLHAFAWFGEHSDELAYFNGYMATRRNANISWLSIYPVAKELEGLNDPERPIYVNMGGGIGHQCAEFRKQFPDIPGRVILQDLQHSIDQALPTPGVENMVHSFFEPQPIQGAKFYFMRGVLHNHPDQKVSMVLHAAKRAMAPDSILILDEVMLPEIGVGHDAAAHDMTMMAAFASMERTEAQWRVLVEEAGLKLTKTYMYNVSSYETVMDVRLD